MNNFLVRKSGGVTLATFATRQEAWKDMVARSEHDASLDLWVLEDDGGKHLAELAGGVA